MSEAAAWIERAIARYGGRQRWQALCLSLEVTSLSGLLPWHKGLGRTFPMPTRVEVTPAEGWARFLDYPERGVASRFERGRVAVGEAALAEHRATFAGTRKWRRWAPIDAVYFFGYALTHYHALPFSLVEAEVRAWDAERRALTVAFAPEVHTHGRVQTIHFDESGLIVRHDYVAEVVGGWARGAHFWREYVDVGGFPLATHRHVRARLGRHVLPVAALDARLKVVELNNG